MTHLCIMLYTYWTPLVSIGSLSLEGELIKLPIAIAILYCYVTWLHFSRDLASSGNHSDKSNLNVVRERCVCYGGFDWSATMCLCVTKALIGRWRCVCVLRRFWFVGYNAFVCYGGSDWSVMMCLCVTKAVVPVGDDVFVCYNGFDWSVTMCLCITKAFIGRWLLLWLLQRFWLVGYDVCLCVVRRNSFSWRDDIGFRLDWPALDLLVISGWPISDKGSGLINTLWILLNSIFTYYLQWNHQYCYLKNIVEIK